MDPNKKCVLAFGELLWDLLPSGKVLGGAPANFAVHLNALGIPVYLVSRVGNDELGNLALQQLSSRGLDLSLVQKDFSHTTGTVDVSLDNKGNPSFVINPNVAYDFIELEPSLIEKAQSSSVICYGSLVQRTEKTRSTLYSLLKNSPHVTKILDINLRKNCYTPETLKASLEFADILKLNEDELHEVAEMFILRTDNIKTTTSNLIHQFQLESCLVTRGDKGVFALTEQGETAEYPANKVKVIDTIGSGDAFTAGFVIRLIEGESFAKCCEFGNRLGGMVAATKGGMTPISKAEIDSFR